MKYCNNCNIPMTFLTYELGGICPTCYRSLLKQYIDQVGEDPE